MITGLLLLGALIALGNIYVWAIANDVDAKNAGSIGPLALRDTPFKVREAKKKYQGKSGAKNTDDENVEAPDDTKKELKLDKPPRRGFKKKPTDNNLGDLSKRPESNEQEFDLGKKYGVKAGSGRTRGHAGGRNNNTGRNTRRR